VTKEKYNAIRNIFCQNALSRLVLANKVPGVIDNSFLGIGELEYWCWRYVYMKDITNKTMTNRLIKLKFDNLTIMEIMKALNLTKELVRDIVDKAHDAVKKNPRLVKSFLKGKTK
jgi:hypothetical protein